MNDAASHESELPPAPSSRKNAHLSKKYSKNTLPAFSRKHHPPIPSTQSNKPKDNKQDITKSSQKHSCRKYASDNHVFRTLSTYIT
jgi:hypothetical protein